MKYAVYGPRFGQPKWLLEFCQYMGGFLAVHACTLVTKRLLGLDWVFREGVRDVGGREIFVLSANHLAIMDECDFVIVNLPDEHKVVKYARKLCKPVYSLYGRERVTAVQDTFRVFLARLDLLTDEEVLDVCQNQLTNF